MALLSLYIDTNSNTLISGVPNGSIVDPKTLSFFFGGVLSLQVYPCSQLPGGTILNKQYQFSGVAGKTLELYLNGGFSDSTIYTSQTVWNTDPANEYFYADLVMNTTALGSLLKKKLQAEVYLTIGMTENGQRNPIYSDIVIVGCGLPAVSFQVPPGLTPLSQEAAQAEFYPIAGKSGMPLYLISPNGKKFVQQAVDNPDGTANVQGWAQVN